MTIVIQQDLFSDFRDINGYALLQQKETRNRDILVKTSPEASCPPFAESSTYDSQPPAPKVPSHVPLETTQKFSYLLVGGDSDLSPDSSPTNSAVDVSRSDAFTTNRAIRSSSSSEKLPEGLKYLTSKWRGKRTNWYLDRRNLQLAQPYVRPDSPLLSDGSLYLHLPGPDTSSVRIWVLGCTDGCPIWIPSEMGTRHPSEDTYLYINDSAHPSWVKRKTLQKYLSAKAP
ncbi:MAG TPA: hypothetical protein VGO47_12910 [Chlamydiales bacterium]|jgi:hypothetical protein|nr:hypothetical protein [Chlamydiales bacterium]